MYSQYLVNFTLSYTLFSVPEKCKNPHGDDSGLYHVTPHLIKREAINEAKLHCILLLVRLITVWDHFSSLLRPDKVTLQCRMLQSVVIVAHTVSGASNPVTPKVVNVNCQGSESRLYCFTIIVMDNESFLWLWVGEPLGSALCR